MVRVWVDEQINVFTILRTSGRLTDLRNHLPYLTLSLEVQAFGSEFTSSESHSSGNASIQPPKRDVIWAGAVDTTQPPASVSDGDQSALVWVSNCFLSLYSDKRLPRAFR